MKRRKSILNRVIYSHQAGDNLHTAEISISRPYPLTHFGAARIMQKDGVKFVSIHRVETWVDER